LAQARLSSLARDWLAAGQGDRLADACERTWTELTAVNRTPAVYWYEEVAARTHTELLKPAANDHLQILAGVETGE
jgi:hypothetical protein